MVRRQLAVFRLLSSSPPVLKLLFPLLDPVTTPKTVCLHQLVVFHLQSFSQPAPRSFLLPDLVMSRKTVFLLQRAAFRRPLCSPLAQRSFPLLDQAMTPKTAIPLQLAVFLPPSSSQHPPWSSHHLLPAPLSCPRAWRTLPRSVQLVDCLLRLFNLPLQ